MIEIFVVEDEDGDLLDTTGQGGCSVFTSRFYAQYALETEESASDEDFGWRVVRYVREGAA